MKKWLKCIATAIGITAVLLLDVGGLVLFIATLHIAYLLPLIFSFIAWLSVLIYSTTD